MFATCSICARNQSLVSTDVATFAGLVLANADLLHGKDTEGSGDAQGLLLEVRVRLQLRQGVDVLGRMWSTICPCVCIPLQVTQVNGVVGQWFGCSVDVCQWTDAWIQVFFQPISNLVYSLLLVAGWGWLVSTRNGYLPILTHALTSLMHTHASTLNDPHPLTHSLILTPS